MDELELTQAIVDYITSWYKATYNGQIEVEKEDGIYNLKIAIPSYMAKTTIGGQFSSDEDFLDYIYKEIRERNYMKVYFYKVNRTETNIEQ